MIKALDNMETLASWGAEFVMVAKRDKFPIGKAWPAGATSDVSCVRRWLMSGYNVGLLLGSGNLIDVEYDSDAGRRCIDALGLLDVETPTWSSGRGQHRLFRLDGPVPPWGWRSISGMEIRFGGKPAQSVLPPSRHPNGGAYEWIVSPAECQPAAITMDRLGVKA